MEITDMNIISDFEAGIKYLENPSLISRFFSISGIQTIVPPYSFWKWGALILAFFATFCRLINRLVFAFLKIRTIKTINSSLKPLLDDEDFDCSDCDTSSSVAESDDEDSESTSSFEDREPVDEDFRVAGSSYYTGEEDQNGSKKLRRRRIAGRCFSWSDFAAGKSVVQLWDRIGLGLDFQESLGSEISIWDIDTNQKLRSFWSGRFDIPAVDMSSPVVVLSARMENSESIELDAYDGRVAREIPVMNADWLSRLGNVVGISSGGVEKVYVVDDVTGNVTVGDLRNVKTPVEKLTGLDCR